MVKNWQKIVEDNINLVYYFSHNEDEQGAGMLGLVKGARTYDSNLGYKLSTYLGRCIINEIHMYHRKNNKFYNEIPIAEEDFPFTKTKSIEEELIEQENLEILRRSIEDLKEKDKLIIKYYYGLDNCKQLTQIELSKKFNLSQAQVSRKINKILKKFRKEIIS